MSFTHPNLIDISGLLVYNQHMKDLPLEVQNIIFQDAVERDTVTARRKRLLEILWHERYITRTGLMVRVEAVSGKSCFGESAWEDTFYRDMRVVKRAFQAAGYELAYSRSHNCPGYYLRNQPSISPALKDAITGAVADVDPNQVAITRQLQLKKRIQQGFSISNLANQVVAFRQNKPKRSNG